MAGFIILEDGRAFAGGNRGIDLALEYLAAELPDGPFRSWLLDQRAKIRGMGLTSVDLRELAPDNREVFYRAVRAAAVGVRDRDPEFAEFFDHLPEMIRRWEAGEPPEEYNPHMRALIPPTGDRRGPGWE
ncbi:hypothetical protein [Micromonospora endolithica]|uniref:Uncharacterized protein n=1 Tax=Micromonospora endolithica TaxID=230091 RepID=A0A3A9ZKZ1_9ACTN|nr:hypothetical protein [Micromonospora endolithica]RKN48474.1 hypothetical protein D7223_10805 [Micromonospora endolithica]TWJ24442.1 hypothetical protein JD76_04592 [Micromonospora endolithica]